MGKAIRKPGKVKLPARARRSSFGGGSVMDGSPMRVMGYRARVRGWSSMGDKINPATKVNVNIRNKVKKF